MLVFCIQTHTWIDPRRAQLGVVAAAVACAALVIVQRGGLAGGPAGTELLSKHGGHNTAPEDVSLKLRKVPGAGYATSSVEGLRAKALLAQAKATAKKGVGDLEAASAAHLQLERKSAQLRKAIQRRQSFLANVDTQEADANKSEEVAAESLLHAKDATHTVDKSTESAHGAELEAQADSSEAIATETKARAAFERAIQDAIDERTSAEGLVRTEKNIAHLQEHMKNLKQRLLSMGTWEPWHGGSHDAHFKGRGRGRSLALSRRRGVGGARGTDTDALDDKMVHTHVGRPFVH